MDRADSTFGKILIGSIDALRADVRQVRDTLNEFRDEVRSGYSRTEECITRTDEVKEEVSGVDRRLALVETMQAEHRGEKRVGGKVIAFILSAVLLLGGWLLGKRS